MYSNRGRSGSGGSKCNKNAIASGIRQSQWKIPENSDDPIEPLPPEGVDAVHNTAMRILEEVGVEFLKLEAVNIFTA